MRSARFSSLLVFLVTLFNRIVCAKLALTSWPDPVYTNKTYAISWNGGDNSAVTVSLLLKDSSGSLSTLGTLWTGTGTYIHWTVGISLKASAYYVIKVAQDGDADYSDYFTLFVSSASTSSTATSRTSTSTSTSASLSTYTSISTRISSVPTTVTDISTITPNCTSTTTSSSSSTSSAPSLTVSTVTATLSSSPSPTSTGVLSQTPSSSKSHSVVAAVIVIIVIAIVAILVAVFLIRIRPAQKRKTHNIPDRTYLIPPPSQASSQEPPNTAHMTAMGPDPIPAPMQTYQNQYQQQQFPNQNFDQQYPPPQNYQQYQPFQQSSNAPLPQTYQPYKPYQQPYQQQTYAQEFPAPPPPSHLMQQQQYQPHPPFQHYNQVPPPLPSEGHELATMEDVKRPEMLNSHNDGSNMFNSTSMSTYSGPHPQGTFNDVSGELDGSMLPRYERVAPAALDQPGQQQSQQQQTSHGAGAGTGHVYEMG